MISLRQSWERRAVEQSGRTSWLSFDSGDSADAFADGFGALLNLCETLLAPGAGARSVLLRECESLVYVREGAVGFEDSAGSSGVLRAGEFQRVAGGPGTRRSERNASPTHQAHVFQACLLDSEAGSGEAQAPRRFSFAARRGGLCLVASPDARAGSLRIQQDVRIYSALLDPGQHAVHELATGRVAWLHVVRGEATLGDVVLTTGDGAGVEAERCVSLTARGDTEVLLFDLDGSELRSVRERRA
jgi:redox-sensitive bicupin YhaK (pirin superfamily)